MNEEPDLNAMSEADMAQYATLVLRVVRRRWRQVGFRFQARAEQERALESSLRIVAQGQTLCIRFTGGFNTPTHTKLPNRVEIWAGEKGYKR